MREQLRLRILEVVSDMGRFTQKALTPSQSLELDRDGTFRRTKYEDHRNRDQEWVFQGGRTAFDRFRKGQEE